MQRTAGTCIVRPPFSSNFFCSNSFDGMGYSMVKKNKLSADEKERRFRVRSFRKFMQERKGIKNVFEGFRNVSFQPINIFTPIAANLFGYH